MNIKQILSYLFPCFTTNRSDNLYSNNSISSFWGNHNNETIQMINIAPSKPPIICDQACVAMANNELFLINKPSTYNKLIDSFINYHGPNSFQVKSLISPEIDLADRAYNIHIITGNNVQPFFYNTLKNKSSLSKLLDNSNQVISYSDGESGGSTPMASSVDLSMIGIDRFLLDYGEAANLALDLFS